MQQPTGGPKDVKAPKVLKEFPKNLSTIFKAKEIKIEFDEFIKLNNAFAEVSISPALEIPLEVKSKKTELEIKIEQPLEENTTYTINFGKAIGDVNENNQLKNYTYVFSTGPVVDSLSISGSVTNSLNNEKLKDATVFILPVKQDSLFGKKKPSIYTNTDSAGNFKLSNLRADVYRIYALKEASANRIYDAGAEEIGFIAEPIDLNKNVNGLNFKVFKENQQEIKITERKIESDGRILLTLNKSVENLEIRELGSDQVLKQAVIEKGIKGDSVMIWVPELKFDSLKLGLYQENKLVSETNIYRNKREDLNRTPIIKDNLLNNKLKPGTAVELILSMPAIGKIDTNKISLISDSVALKGWSVNRKKGSERKFVMDYAFRNGNTYQLKIAEGAFTGISGLKNQSYNKTFTADDLDNYGNLSLIINRLDTTKQYVVQLINEQKNIIREDIVNKETVINYKTYTTGKYSLRFVVDENRNGKWDTGNLKEKVQPEKIWNYGQGITLRANWDQEEKITIPKDL